MKKIYETQPLMPIKVSVLDDDDGSLNWYTKLLLVDPRTTVNLKTRSATRLLEFLAEDQIPDILLLDVDINSKGSNYFIDLISKVKICAPNVKIICYSPYIDPEIISGVIVDGINGFLLKSELRYSIATAVTLVNRNHFVVTPSVMKVADPGWLPRQTKLIHYSEPEDLSSVQIEAIDFCILYGMRASVAGKEIYKSPTTMDTYIRDSFSILKNRTKDEGLEDINWEQQKRADQVFLLYTQPEVLTT